MEILSPPPPAAATIFLVAALAAGCSDGITPPAISGTASYSLEGGASANCTRASGYYFLPGGHFDEDSTAYDSPTVCFDLPAGTTVTVKAQYKLTVDHQINIGHRFYRKEVDFEGVPINADSVLLASFTRSELIWYPPDSNIFNNITIPSGAGGLRIYLDIDDEENDLMWMELFRQLSPPSGLTAQLNNYQEAELTWVNGETISPVTTRVLRGPTVIEDDSAGVSSTRITLAGFGTTYGFRILHRVPTAGGSPITLLSDTTATVWITTPDSLWTRIKGPAQVRPNQTCTWTTAVVGGNPPYSITWFKNGRKAGTGTDLITSSQFNFTLKVKVTSDDGQAAQDVLAVTVSQSAPPKCFK